MMIGPIVLGLKYILIRMVSIGHSVYMYDIATSVKGGHLEHLYPIQC